MRGILEVKFTLRVYELLLSHITMLHLFLNDSNSYTYIISHFTKERWAHLNNFNTLKFQSLQSAKFHGEKNERMQFP